MDRRTDLQRGIVVPDVLERLVVERALGEAALGRAAQAYLSKADLARASRAMLELSDRFNRIDESLGPDYMESPAHRAAYLLYFLPANFAKARAVLAELAPTLAGRESLSVLDVGSGPGSMSLAALETFAAQPGIRRLDFTAMDTSRAALEEYDFLIRRRAEDFSTQTGAPEVTLTTSVTDLETAAFAERRRDLILVGDALNELFRGARDPVAARAAFLEGLAANLAEDGALVVIEPSLKSITRRLQAVRDLIAGKEGLHVRAPCLREGPCPMLAEGRERDWCHAGALWMRPPFVRRIDKATGRKKFILKFAHLVIRRHAAAPAEAPPGMTAFRAVGDMRREKGRLRIMLCGEGGCEMATLLKRDVNDKTRAFTAVERGDVVALDSWAGRKDGWRLSADTAVEILSRCNEDGVSRGNAASRG